MARDALVVVDEVAAAVEDQLAAAPLDAFRMVRRVAVQHVDPARINQPVRELLLLDRNAIAPVAAPVNRDHDDVPCALFGADALGQSIGTARR